MANTVNFNGTTPAPAANRQNVQWQADASNPANISCSDPVMVGDTGAGGKAGNVPAPAAGDAAAGKHLRADGTWAVPVIPASDVAGLAAVATSGSYADLTGKPAIPAAQVNSDWNSGAGVSQILNKPALAASATTDTTNASNITSGTLNATLFADNSIPEAKVGNLLSDLSGLSAGQAGLSSSLASKAPIANPIFSGSVTAPKLNQSAAGQFATTITVAAGTNGIWTYPAAFLTAIPICLVSCRNTPSGAAWLYNPDSDQVTITNLSGGPLTFDIIVIGNPN